MARTAQLYLKTDKGVRGPFSAYRLHEMVRRGNIRKDTKVSADGMKWLDAEKIRGLFSPVNHSRVADKPKTAPAPAPRPELEMIVNRLEIGLRRTKLSFRTIVGATVMASLFTLFALCYAIISKLVPYANVVLLFSAAILPAALVAAAVGQAVGNKVVAHFCGISDNERRCLALHLPQNRVPVRWPIYLKNWVYAGDWLLLNDESELLPYARAFITGAPPKDVDSEIRVWNELLSRAGGGDSDIEVGRAVRELACVDALPEWTKDVDNGANLADLEMQLGNVARDWASCLLKRASNKLPEFMGIGTGAELDLISFEFYHTELSTGGEALLVLIRPRSSRISERRIVRKSVAA